jgi:hypothetical protein
MTHDSMLSVSASTSVDLPIPSGPLRTMNIVVAKISRLSPVALPSPEA